jgi:glycolate oxidase iron-sulfur subunit
VPGWLYQKVGLRWLAHNSGLLKLLPIPARAMEGLMPQVSLGALWSDLPAVVKAQGTRRRRVGLLLGCVQRVFFPGVNAATARVLSAEGCDVIIPHEQSCCGALMVHAGREEEALAFARNLIDVFERAQVDTVVVNAAGCGSSMKDYGYMLRNDPVYADKARAFSARCRDVSEVLAELEPRAPRQPLPLRVAYHDSCHLQHAQGVRNQPRAVLASIPQLQLLEVPEAALCCGSAGIYNLVEPGPAKELGDRKTANVISTRPDLLVSANPGCLLQIQSGLERAGKNIPVRHLVEVVDASIRGVNVI